MICPKCSKQHDVPSSKIPYPSNEGHFLCPDCRTPLECSSDMVRGISADKVLIDDVEQDFDYNIVDPNAAEQSVPSLEHKIKQAIIDTIGSDRPFMDVPDIAEEITQKVMEVVGQNTQRACEYCGKPGNSPNYAYHICASVKKEVVVTITGGVADVDEIPPGVIVKIRDYDVEGCDEDELGRDKEGKRYIEAVFAEDDLVRDEALTDKEQEIVKDILDADCYVGDDDDGEPS